MKKDFVLFQKEFKVWQQRLGLTGYKVFFKYEDIGTCFASIKVNQEDMVGVVRFNSSILEDDKQHLDVKAVALHEALHLLLGRLTSCAKWRYATIEEIFEADEEAVNKIEALLRHRGA